MVHTEGVTILETAKLLMSLSVICPTPDSWADVEYIWRSRPPEERRAWMKKARLMQKLFGTKGKKP